MERVTGEVKRAPSLPKQILERRDPRLDWEIDT